MNLIRRDRVNRTSGGVAIAIKKGITYDEVTLDDTIVNNEELEPLQFK